jgi:hypothetical protein
MLVGFLLFRLKKLFPLRYSPEEMAMPLPELYRKYRMHTWLGVAAFLVLTPLCVYLCLLAVQACVVSRLPDIAGPIEAIRPGTGILLVVSWFPGIVLACCLIAAIQRLMLGRQGSKEFRMMGNRRVGFNSTKLYIALGTLMVAGSLSMAVFAVRTAVFLGRDEIVLRRMWSWQEERYSYDRVKALREEWDADNGKWNFVMRFDGGPEWSTRQEVVFPDDAQEAVVSRRTGKPIVKVQ